jgi:hypothetical protein
MSESPKPLSLAKPAHVGLGLRQIFSILAHANQGLHGLLAVSGGAAVLIADRLPNELGNAAALLPGSDMKCFPDVLMEVQLRTFHDV